MERNLIQYLPYVVRRYWEFCEIMEAEQPEFETVWACMEDLLDNQFLHTAGNLGLSRWERILKITPRGTDTLDERRFRILAKLNETLPYTLPQLRVILETLCGEGNATADIEEGSYLLLVKVGLAAKKNFEDVRELLQRVVPANIRIQLMQIYNPHQTLSRFTHKQLAKYTHEQLRNEVFTNGE